MCSRVSRPRLSAALPKAEPAPVRRAAVQGRGADPRQSCGDVSAGRTEPGLGGGLLPGRAALGLGSWVWVFVTWA